MIRTHIAVQIPSVAVLAPQEIPETLQRLSTMPLTTVWLEFTGMYSGNVVLAFPPEGTSTLVAALTNKTPETLDFDAVRAATLSEMGNVVLSRMIEAMGNMSRQRLTFSLPAYVEDTVENLLALSGARSDVGIIFGKTGFTIASLQIEGCLLLLSPLSA